MVANSCKLAYDLITLGAWLLGVCDIGEITEWLA